MAYLYYRDYERLIQAENLTQVVNSDDDLRVEMQETALEEVKSYIVQRFDMTNELRDLAVYSLTDTYVGKSRVYLNADTYVGANSYVANDLTLFSGNVYICINATTGTFTPADWALLGPRWAIFVATTPYPVFDYETSYTAGDQVWYLGSNYTAIQNAEGIKPTDTDYWQNDGTYSFSGELPTDTNFFTAGDDRNKQIRMYMVDICLYHLLTRIAPRNTPQNRIDRYFAAISWLKMVARGEVTANLPLIQPEQGGRIRWGSYTKLDLNY